MKGERKMIKLKAKETFTLGQFKELKNLKRHNVNQNQDGWLYKDDEFECEENLAKYLLNETGNPINRAVAEIIEYIPQKKAEEKPVKEIKRKTTTKKTKNID